MWLLLLVALPFSAPFATCDPGRGAHPIEALTKSIHDVTRLKGRASSPSPRLGVPSWSPSALLLAVAEPAAIDPAPHADRRQAQHNILRL